VPMQSPMQRHSLAPLCAYDCDAHLRETDCVAGHARLELRDVGAKYPFERSHRFPVIEPNSGHRDYARSKCDGGATRTLARIRMLALAVSYN
jgi:hypothetical protein